MKLIFIFSFFLLFFIPTIFCDSFFHFFFNAPSIPKRFFFFSFSVRFANERNELIAWEMSEKMALFIRELKRVYQHHQHQQQHRHNDSLSYLPRFMLSERNERFLFFLARGIYAISPAWLLLNISGNKNLVDINERREAKKKERKKKCCAFFSFS